MHTHLPLIATIAMSLTLALVFGFIASKLKLPMIVGYLFAGVLLGPFTPGLEADTDLAQELAEIGIMLLMFGVGLHFSLDDLAKVKKIAVPGALIQMLTTSLLGFMTAVFWGWAYGTAIIFGLSLCVASTVVLLRALEERNVLHTMSGHIAVGWLIVEDIVMVLVLVLIPAFKDTLLGHTATPSWSTLGWILGLTTLKLLVFCILMFYGGKFLLPRLLWKISRTGSRELFTLCIITAAIGIAFEASQIFNVSFALGAFFSGMIIRESTFSHRVAQESLPLRDAFAVLFFVSVGMLFDPSVFLSHPYKILVVLLIIVVGKGLSALLLVRAFSYPLHSALLIAVSLAQIGEFSFILVELGVDLKLLPIAGRSYILAAALISIALNPLLFKALKPYQKKLIKENKDESPKSNNPLMKLPETIDKAKLKDHVIVVGYGRVGKFVSDQLLEQHIPFIIIDDNKETIESLRLSKVNALLGNASEASILKESCITNAKLMMILVSDLFNTRKIIHGVKNINTELEMVVRTHNEREAALLKNEHIKKVFFAEEEIANNMAFYLINRYRNVIL